MLDRIFSAVLTFALLIGGTLAIGSAAFGADPQTGAAKPAYSSVRVVQLDRVLVVAKRQAR